MREEKRLYMLSVMRLLLLLLSPHENVSSAKGEKNKRAARRLHTNQNG